MRIFLIYFLLSSIGYSQVDSSFQKLNVRESNVGPKLSNGMPQRKNTVLWVYPTPRYHVEQYDRMELSVEMPEWINKKIKYFLDTDDSTNGINPFLEWQLDVTATFIHLATGEKKTIDAFYYQSFSRDTSDRDFRNWDWIAEDTPEYMRIRFAPPKHGEWRCDISIGTKDTLFDYNSVNFTTLQSNNKGYLKVGESKRFFTEGDETFFPAGQNLVSPRCEFCFASSSKQLPSPKTGAGAQSFEGWMIEPTVMKGFLMFQDHMKSLSANGGNYFREIMFPQNQDIEWEKLGNYYGRMNRAWEMDEQIFLANELDLKIQLNLQIQFALIYGGSRSFWNWSVDPSDKKHAIASNPCANPYNLGIETTSNDDPNTFFQMKLQKILQTKLRYIFSRWGYSTNLATIGIVSEIEGCCTEGKLCVEWMHEMADYLKNDLEINQMLTPSFLGAYHDPENYEHPILRDTLFEMTTFNWYAASAKKFQGKIKQLNTLLEEFDQPFYFGEMGNGELYPCDTARIEWIRDSWMSAFIGNAGIGMNWDEPFDDELRQHLGNIKKFVYGIDFDGNGNPWIPTRVISDNRKAETVFLLSPDKNAAVGVLSNRYFNWYLYGDTVGMTLDDADLCSKLIPKDPGFNPHEVLEKKAFGKGEYEATPNDYIDRISKSKTKMNDSVLYYPFESFDHEKDKHYRIRIYGMNRASYTVDFYNALTMEYIGSQKNWGPNLQIEYPEMDINTGLIAFKIRRSNKAEFPQINVEDRIPIDYSSAKYIRNLELFQVQNNRYELSVFATENRISVKHLDQLDQNNYSLELLNSKGESVFFKNYSDLEKEFKIEKLLPGTYKNKINDKSS